MIQRHPISRLSVHPFPTFGGRLKVEVRSNRVEPKGKRSPLAKVGSARSPDKVMRELDKVEASQFEIPRYFFESFPKSVNDLPRHVAYRIKKGSDTKVVIEKQWANHGPENPKPPWVEELLK